MYPSVRAFKFSFNKNDLVEEYKEVLGGQKNAEIFLCLWIEVVRLLELWNQHNTLFSSENLPVLKNTRERFWAFQQSIMKDAIVLSFSRLTDDIRSGGHEHLSIFQMQKLFDSTGEKDDKKALSSTFKEIRKRRGSVKAIRNTMIAHNDLRYTLNPTEFTENVSFGELEDLLELLKETIQITENRFGLCDDPGWSDHTYNQAESFLASLRYLQEKSGDS